MHALTKQVRPLLTSTLQQAHITGLLLGILGISEAELVMPTHYYSYSIRPVESRNDSPNAPLVSKSNQILKILCIHQNRKKGQMTTNYYFPSSNCWKLRNLTSPSSNQSLPTHVYANAFLHDFSLSKQCKVIGSLHLCKQVLSLY